MLTSEYEGFGLVIVEGMSFGVSPIVYGSFSAAYDLVDHGKDGCILPAASGFQAHRMAEMAAGLMREPADLHAMARNAIAKSRKFTREHIIPQWEKLSAQTPPEHAFPLSLYMEQTRKQTDIAFTVSGRLAASCAVAYMALPTILFCWDGSGPCSPFRPLRP